MLLAGGQGSRLYTLTQNLAKPAVPFGGKYRIIDFPLSNCVNSGIDTVGVLTQYQPLVLNEYIGNGQPWDLDRSNGGVFVLPPYQKSSGSDWYTGTANAIYQNINFIERYDPEYVLILSGDHIYKMDYEKMLDFHKEKEADCTIAVLQVPLEEASRFGIMNTYPDGTIYEFEEKPPKPKSNLASMGIYIFSWKKMRKYLIDDESNPNSSKDFGKNILPAMLADGQKMVAYPFEGYWKDVGTIDSLWEANMDLLKEKPELDLSDDSWRIYGKNLVKPPHYIGEEAKVKNSIIGDGCTVLGEIENCILFPSVVIEKGAVVRNSVIMQETVIQEGAVVEKSILDEQVTIMENAKIGGPEKITVIGSELSIPKGAEVAEGEMLYPSMK